MKKINNKGFTLVEVLAIIVILGILITIIAPNVTTLINENKKNSLEKLNTSITSAAKLYISDHKYEIKLTSSTCNANDTIDIDKIGNTDLNPNNQIKIRTLVDEGNISTSSDGNIYNPENKEQKLNLDNSYIIVKYNCKTKDYIYYKDVPNDEVYLEWQ